MKLWASLLLEKNIPIENTGTKHRLSNARLYFRSEGASGRMGKTRTKGGGQSIPPYIPEQIICFLTWIGPDQSPPFS
jgi:hypothetical protein